MKTFSADREATPRRRGRILTRLAALVRRGDHSLPSREQARRRIRGRQGLYASLSPEARAALLSATEPAASGGPDR